MMMFMNMKTMIMNKVLLSLLLSISFITPVFAEDQDELNPEEKQEEKPVLFDNIQDRTQQLNQEYSNNPIYSPFNAPFSQARFVPDIAFIMDFSYAHRDKANDSLSSLTNPGYSKSDGGLNRKNGFNFNYAELALASSVDNYFDLFSNFHLSEFGFEIEEAYINTRGLPWGFQIKTGKFLSSFGRINSQHSHYWDFADSPLVFNNMLGEHNILEKGVQINWLAPTDLYLLAGAEFFSGENEKSFGNRGFTSGTNKLEEVNGPNLFTGFIKTSLDFDDLIILGGLSYAQGGTRLLAESEESSSGGHMHVHALDNMSGSFAGGSRIFGADLTAKYLFDSYRYLSWQSEFLHRSLSGTQYNVNSKIALSQEQSGLYSQLIWKFNQQWRLGARLDLLLGNNVIEDNKNLNFAGYQPKYTAMVDFNPTEFSRIRLQYNHDRSRYIDSTQQAVNEVFLQLNMAIGAHGAHSF